MVIHESLTEAFVQKHGRAVQKELRRINNNTGNSRAAWIKIGEHGSVVRDRGVRGSGLLKDFAEKYINTKTAAVLISRAIWIYEHPNAAGLVDVKITYPDSVYKKWGKIADQYLDAFVAAGRNNLDALACELGVSERELSKRHQNALKRAQKGINKPTDRDFERMQFQGQNSPKHDPTSSALPVRDPITVLRDQFEYTDDPTKLESIRCDLKNLYEDLIKKISEVDDTNKPFHSNPENG